MKEKLTREMVVRSIIGLINEHREGCVGEDAQLGRIHIGRSTVSWMYDWLKEEYDWAEMKMPTEDEIQSLRQGDTIGKLADIAMRHCNADAEREVEDPHDGKTHEQKGEQRMERYVLGYRITEESLDLREKVSKNMSARDTAKWLFDMAKKVIDGKVRAFSAEVAVAREKAE